MEINTTRRVRIPNDTMVYVTRNHRFGYDPRSPSGYEYGPMTINQAQDEGLLTTSGDTMRYKMLVAAGNYQGCRVEKAGKNSHVAVYYETEIVEL